MGISNRDYVRDERPAGFGGMSSGQWAIKYLVIANIAVFILQNVTGRVIGFDGGGTAFVGGVTEWFSLSVTDLYTGQVWRLLTYGFCHSPQLSHLLFNMLFLWMFGRAVEPILGSREFLAFYLGGVLFSGICHVVLQAVEQSNAGVIGASGGVMAVVFLTAATFPRMKVYVMLVLPMDLWIMAIIYAVLDIIGMLNPGGSPVAHAAHLGGAAFGVAYKYYNWRLSPLWQRMTGWASGIKRRRRHNPNVRIFEPPKEPDTDQVDRLLAKIHEHGEASLTDEEREFLIEASRRMKPR